MTCVLTTGRTLACRDSIGGIKEVYISELDNKNSIVAATEGLISTFTLDNGKQFWTLGLVKETSNFAEKIAPSTENGTLFYETTLNLIFNKRDVATRNLVKLMAQNRLMIIILDRNGVYWLMGEENGAEMIESSSMTGTAMGDRNGYEINFIAKEAQPMSQVTTGLVAVLLEPSEES
jgi:hypothetical protein